MKRVASMDFTRSNVQRIDDEIVLEDGLQLYGNDCR